MQNFNLIAQSVLKLSHCEIDHNDKDNNNDDDADTHQGWIIVRDGKYSVADKNSEDASIGCRSHLFAYHINWVGYFQRNKLPFFNPRGFGVTNLNRRILLRNYCENKYIY